MHGDTICADDASESMAIGHKLGRTLKEVPNPAGHPMRILMSAQPTCGDGGYGDLAGYPYPSDPTPPPLTKELYKDIQVGSVNSPSLPWTILGDKICEPA